MKIAPGHYKYEREGQEWETRNIQYIRWNGEPCVYVEVRGDLETYFSADTTIIHRHDLTDGWVGVWCVSTAPELCASNRELTELLEYGRERGWNE